jgi:uncharacterized protein with GYD domain
MRYVVLLRNDAVGAGRMLHGLVSGHEEFPRSVARFNGQLVELLAVGGRYDAVAIIDFKDHASALAFTLAATAQGQYAEGLPVFSEADLRRASQVAESAGEVFARDVAETIEALADNADGEESR